MDVFYLQLLTSFVLSVLIVIAVTVLAEKYGTKVGGILGTLPHLIIVAFVFIALNKGEDFASDAAHIVPAEVGVNILFLFLFAHFSRQNLGKAIVVSLGVWAVLSFILVVGEFTNIYSSLLIYGLSAVGCFFILEHHLEVGSGGQVKVHYTPVKLVLRGVLAGIVIASSVALSEMGSAISGIFTVFPAMFLSTVVIMYLEHGPDFSSGMAKSMIFGTPSVVSYAVGVHFLYPEFGIFWGSLGSVALAVTVCAVIFSFREQMK